MKTKWAAGAVILAMVLGAIGLSSAVARTAASTADVTPFQAAGAIGGGVLTPGDVFPPTSAGNATLLRKSNSMKVSIQTSGLPAGAYTVWWVVFNNPAACDGPCDEPDLFTPAVSASVFWATGGIVTANGKGNFHAEYQLGDSRGTPGTQSILDGGAIDLGVAEVHNIIKYHGPPSDDADTLYDQTHTLLGSCFVGANAVDLGAPFGVNCFDPQAVAHPLP